MYHFRGFVEKYNIDKQLPDFVIEARDDRLLMDSIDYRIDVYGWPDNRIVASNKITGHHTIKRFGPKKTEEAKRYLLTCLGVLGLDTLEAEWDPEAFNNAIAATLCDECEENNAD